MSIKLKANTFFSTNKKGAVVSLSFLILFIVGTSCFFVGEVVQEMKYVSFLKSFKNIRENSDKYKFINPLIGSISAPATSVGIFTDIKDDIVSYLQQEKKNNNLYGYSFYFRDIGTGLWFGDNENANFFPASLFKLPVAIAVYKEAEDDRAFLKKSVVYTSEISSLNDAVQSNSKSGLVVGKAYSVEDLVSIMLRDSDNGAKNLLLTVLDKSYIDKLFEAVALIDPSKEKSYTISSRQYALFIRILYGSSYLNEEHSEYLMSLLAHASFEDGIVAGVPKGVMVAHKYGAYELESPYGVITRHSQQLNDCGIVYHEEKPYIFCFMVNGKDLPSLYKIISHVSKLVYDNQESEELYND